jgi:hypothetical protein
MHCNWCHGAILEDPRSSSDGFSVHYWCLDFIEELSVVPSRLRRFGVILRQAVRRLSRRPARA